ncbi:MAG: hypothetical protein DRG78_11455 [Epsilonproteobacteria bacterium]|nr:MAG: hypothetical protein DRG78_11455 [Campylobacterota bacterium]
MRIREVALLCLSPLIWAQTVSFPEILEYATQNATILKIKSTDTLIESKNIKVQEAAYYPSFDVSYNAEYNQALDGIPLGVESVGGETISNGTRYQSSIALKLNYDLYHFGATDKRVDIASSSLDIKRVEWCEQEKQLHQEILQKYSDALKSDIEKHYKAEMLNLRKDLYSMKERLYKIGRYSKVDLGDEAIYMIGLQRDIENSQMFYKESLIKLSQLSYKELSDKTHLLPFTTELEDGIVEDYEDTTQAVILRKKIKQKKDEISLQFREQLPSFGLYSSYYMYASHPRGYEYTITQINKKSWNVGLSLRYNIFEGFKHSASEEQLKLELSRLEQEMFDSKHNHTYELKSKLTKIDELNLIREHEQNLLDENYKKRDMLEKLHKFKKVDMLTKINAQYELLERELTIKIREIEAAYENISLSIVHRGINKCSPH